MKIHRVGDQDVIVCCDPMDEDLDTCWTLADGSLYSNDSYPEPIHECEYCERPVRVL